VNRGSRTAAHDYWAFGLRIRSSTELPELVDAEGDDKPDVVIDYGDIPETVETGLTAAGDALTLSIENVGRYRIERGTRIIIDAEPDVPERNVRLFLLGSAFGALLHQRGLLPLHANAIELDGRAVAFMGEQGAGKSTLASWFHDHGYGVLADDVCAIGFDSRRHPMVYPGLPRLRLWVDAMSAAGRAPQEYQRSYVDAAYDKFDVPTDPPGQASAGRELAGLYVLDRAEDFSIEPLKGVDAMEAVFAHTYRGAYLGAIGGQQNHWQSCTHLVMRTPVFRLCRPWSLDRLTEDCLRIAEHAAGLCLHSGVPPL
jgi:hypothetical protein